MTTARWQPASIARDIAPVPRRVSRAITSAPITRVRFRRPTVRDAGLPCTLQKDRRSAKAKWDASRPGGRMHRLTYDQMTKLRFAIYLRLNEPVYRQHWQIANEFGVCVEPLAPRSDLRNHSQSFEWGYLGSGASQLALALCADVLCDDERAQDVYQDFKFAVVSNLPLAGWCLTDYEIRHAVELCEAERASRDAGGDPDLSRVITEAALDGLGQQDDVIVAGQPTSADDVDVSDVTRDPEPFEFGGGGGFAGGGGGDDF